VLAEQQLHIGLADVLLPEVAPVQNHAWVKPDGGFWTSSFIEGRSEWVDWIDSAGFSDPYSLAWHVLTPDPAARILLVDTLADLHRLLRRCGAEKAYGRRWPDFEAIAAQYDAMHLTSEGQRRTRMTHPDSLYGWDCESTLWFRWCFTKCVSVEPKRAVQAAS
jgi:hypothetical protein